MKMFCPPTDKTCERCQKGAEWGLLAVLAPLVSGGAGIFESQRTAISANSAGVGCSLFGGTNHRLKPNSPAFCAGKFQERHCFGRVFAIVWSFFV